MLLKQFKSFHKFLNALKAVQNLQCFLNSPETYQMLLNK